MNDHVAAVYPVRRRSSVRVLLANPSAALPVAMLLIVVWTAWAAYFNTAQFGDNVEQFNWAQSLELGYHKHPPLPSWLLGSVVRLLGPSVYWAYGLAALCLAGTAALTWSIARELIGSTGAAAAILLWGLNMTFAQRAQLYNHNTVLVLCIAATVWCVLRATKDRPGQPLWWLLAGASAGAAVLSKYQAVVPIAGIVLALLLAGQLRTRANRIGVLLAALTIVGVCLPHASWVVAHDFTTFRYAAEAVTTSGPAQRAGFILSFIANQVRIWSGALLAIVVCLLWQRRTPMPAAGPPPKADSQVGAWMIGLVGAGLVALVVMAMAFGVSLRNHWGAQGLQFLAIAIAWRWQRQGPIDVQRLMIAVLAVHALNLGWYAVEHRNPVFAASERRIDTLYPARRLAYAAIRHWRTQTACPLQYVAGTAFDAGLVALYSGGRLQVFDSESATPWIRRADLDARGALYVFGESEPIPEGVTDVVSFDIVRADPAGRPRRTVRIGLHRPAKPCGS